MVNPSRSAMTLRRGDSNCWHYSRPRRRYSPLIFRWHFGRIAVSTVHQDSIKREIKVLAGGGGSIGKELMANNERFMAASDKRKAPFHWPRQPHALMATCSPNRLRPYCRNRSRTYVSQPAMGQLRGSFPRVSLTSLRGASRVIKFGYVRPHGMTNGSLCEIF